MSKFAVTRYNKYILMEKTLKDHYIDDQEFITDIKQRGIILALNEYIRGMQDIALRDAILSRYITVFEFDEDLYQKYTSELLTMPVSEQTKCISFAKRVQKYWPDVVKDNVVSRIHFFLRDILLEYSCYHEHEIRQISLALAELR